MTQVYIMGQGMVDLTVYRANEACKAYDERCSFKFNEDSRQYCAYMSMPRGFEPPYMIVKGWDHVPHPDDITKWLYQHDTVRIGDRFRTDMNKRNEARKAEQDYKLDQLAGDTSERMEHVVRKAGEHPFPKSFRKITKKK